MFKYRKKIDEKLAEKIVKYLVKTSVTPNQVTTFGLLLAAFAAIFFSFGIYFFSVIGSILFILSKFLDNVDGQLARELKTTSKFGWYYDYFSDTAGYVLMFVGISAGIPPGTFEIKLFTIIQIDIQNYLLFSAIFAALLNTFLALLHNYRTNKEFFAWPQNDKVNLDDGIYLIGPITWIGFINFFFLAASIGSVIYVIYNIKRFITGSK